MHVCFQERLRIMVGASEHLGTLPGTFDERINPAIGGDCLRTGAVRAKWGRFPSSDRVRSLLKAHIATREISQ